MVYKEQAGFRSKRSKTKRIFILRNILERANEWRTRLYVHFVDFEKAFDSVHRENLWKSMISYGRPHKMVRGITNIYQDFDCAVVDGSETSDWFKITSGIKQWVCDARIPILTGLGYDHEGSRQRCWRTLTLQMILRYLSSRYSDLYKKTRGLAEEAARVGLKFSATKCKALRTEFALSRESIMDNGEEV